MKFFKFTAAVATEWDKFVLGNERGSVHQVSAWEKFQVKIKGRGPVYGWGVRNEKGEIVATTFCVGMDTGVMGKKWWYSARGPVFTEEKYGLALVDHVSAELKKLGGLFWRFDPYVAENFVEKSKPATQNYQPTDTLMLEMGKSDDELLAEMKRKGRYNINLARKKGVTCVRVAGGKVTAAELEDFWLLTNETTDRDAFAGHEKVYYENFMKTVIPYADLFFAVAEDGEKIATAISTFAGKRAIYYFGASTSNKEYRNLMAPYLLQWEMVQEAKRRGCETYDFLGIAPENQPKHAYAGISEFKWKFGGARETYAPGREIVFDKKWYTLYKVAKKLR